MQAELNMCPCASIDRGVRFEGSDCEIYLLYKNGQGIMFHSVQIEVHPHSSMAFYDRKPQRIVDVWQKGKVCTQVHQIAGTAVLQQFKVVDGAAGLKCGGPRRHVLRNAFPGHGDVFILTRPNIRVLGTRCIQGYILLITLSQPSSPIDCRYQR